MPLLDPFAIDTLDQDALKVAMLKPGEVLLLKRPPGEGYVSACNRFDAIGKRLGFHLTVWHITTSERWYVKRMR
jgi:hypothetical protein